MTIPVKVSNNFISRKMMYMGTNTPTAGIIFVDRIHKRINSLYLFFINARDQETGIDNEIPKRVDPNEIIMELNAYLK